MKSIIQFIKEKRDFSVFLILSVFVFFFLCFSAPHMGVLGDEEIDANNGKYALKYYLEGDTTFANFPMAQGNILDIPLTQKYYGVGFEIIPAILIKIKALAIHEILIRRLLCALFAFLTAFFTALLAKELRDWKLASVTLLLLFISPTFFGLSLIAVKDIPTAAGFAIAIYGMVRFLKYLPQYKWGSLASVTIGIALALSVRINGLMLMFYFFVAAILCLVFRRDIRQLAFFKPYVFSGKTMLFILVFCFFGVAIGLCFYPNIFHVGVIQHIKDTFNVVSQFPQRIPMLFEGEMINSLNLPPNYLLKNYLITLPFIVFLGLGLFGANAKNVWRKYQPSFIVFILFALIFPISYVIFSKANIYNSWRHLMFVYPLIAIVQAIGIYETYYWFSTSKRVSVWRTFCLLVLIVACLPTLVWMKNNFRYTYSFYNKLVENPHGNYDVEYSETALIHAFDWLVENELKGRTDSVFISTKSGNVIFYKNTKQYPNMRVEKSAVKHFAEVPCDYSILHINFLPQKVLQTFFPPKGTIHVQRMYGRPICAVVKRNKLDARAIELIVQDKIAEGEALLKQAYIYDPNNFGLWFFMGYVNFMQGRYDLAATFYQRYIDFWPSNELLDWIALHMGIKAIKENRYDDAIEMLSRGNVCKNEGLLREMSANMAIAYYHKKDYAKTIEILAPIISFFPDLVPKLSHSYQMSKKL
ncbi:MAG: tetratricopeptide repeat protein [Bacteroidales bacterium]